jgi:anti-sigma B factor antagonist
MTITARSQNDVTILDMKGRLVVGDDTQALKGYIDDLIEAGQLRIVLNLAELNYMDSGGLGELIRTLTAVKRRNGGLKLANLTAKITDLLVITKLVTVFDVYDTELAAVKSF